LANDQEVLNYWIDNSSFRISRRARLVLRYLEGASTKSISESVGMTEQRVLEVISRYQEFGLIGLFEKPRSGRPATPQEEAQLIGLMLVAKFRKEELNVQYLAQGSKQSNDAVWRETRIRNLIISRKRIRTITCRTSLSENIPIVACVLSSDFQMVVMAMNFNNLSKQLLTGVIDGISNEIKENTIFEKNASRVITLEKLILGSIKVKNKIKERMQAERRKRLIKKIDLLEEKIKSPVSFYISGKIESQCLVDWVKTLQHSKYFLLVPQSRFRFFPNFKSSLDTINDDFRIYSKDKFWKSEILNKINHLNEELVWYLSNEELVWYLLR
jgi:transposase